jgi:hypothetical protein
LLSRREPSYLGESHFRRDAGLSRRDSTHRRDSHGSHRRDSELSGVMKHMDAAINKLAAASKSFHAATQDFRRVPNNVAVAT